MLRPWLVGVVLVCGMGCSKAEESPQANKDAGAPPSPTAPVGSGPSGTNPPPGSTAQLDGGSPDGAPTTKQLADGPGTAVATNETLQVDGVTRTYVQAVPDTYSADKLYRLIIALNGNGGTGASMRTAYPLDTTTAGGAIVVYADAIANAWDLYTRWEDNNDDHFIEALIAHLKDTFSISPAHVFGDGWSSGSYMLNQLACRRSTMFRAIVSQTGGAPDEPSDARATTWPETGYTKCFGQTTGVPFLVIQGLSDTSTPPSGGDFTATYWGSVNGCSDTRVATTPSPCVKYDGCPADKPVIYCGIPSLKHVHWSSAATTSWGFLQTF